jgi:hypothetical protein
MAQRPVFLSAVEGKSLAREIAIEFKWHPGMATSQKQKSIRSLHEAAETRIKTDKILEISSRSEIQLGRDLSAFSLFFDLDTGIRTTVECAYQGSKVFRNGGPYTDLYGMDSRTAKTDERIRGGGALISFSLEGQEWPIEPQTFFYDWIYINALHQQTAMANSILNYEAFTDIEYNPEKSFNCQARAAAKYISMNKRGILLDALNDKNLFSSFYRNEKKIAVQQDFF